jgi:ATP-dependent Clp protease ATP-binding subunit ClpA
MEKYLNLPVHLIEFWYPEGVVFFVRTWKNLMLFLEEDLAVTLMWKLLFVPLFHDSSIVGKVLSFLFRFFRILVGLFAFAAASLTLLLIALYWFALPALAVYNFPNYISQGLLFAGVGLFLIHVFTHPHNKVWHTKNLWSASLIKKEEVSLTSLLKMPEVTELLANLELQLDHIPNSEIEDAEKLGKRAFELSKLTGAEYISSAYFFVAALEHIPNIDNLLLKFDLRISDFIDGLSYLEKKKNTWRRIFIWDEDFIIHHLKGVNRGWLGVPTPNLDSFSEDLTKKASKVGFPKLVKQGNILQEVVNILSQTTGRNVVLVGPPGSGKTSLINNLATQIVTGDAPPSLATKRLVMLDLTSLLAGVKTQGELADRVKLMFDEVSFAQNIIIVIEEIQQFGMGEVGTSFNLYSLMQPYLESDTFQFIGTTEAESYSKVLEKNGAFARIFRKVELEQASVSDTLNILEYRSIETERKEKIKTTFIALKVCIQLAQKFIKDRVLPDSAISVLKEAQSEAVEKWVTKDLVKNIVSSRVKVPMVEVGTADKNRLLHLEDELHQRLIGQQLAVKVICDSLRRSATGLTDDDRPIGSFLFVGPTGVGKTELAKTLADTYFKTDGAFIRFDMSEYQNPESVVRLIGQSGEGGLLTEAVRNRPYALVLLDEFEKANDKILTLFLQVLDDGRLTDGAGRTINFENTIIIATSNAGSLLIAKGLQTGKKIEEIDRQVNDELLKLFRPELVNRFDDIVLFEPLSEENLQKIVTLKLNHLQLQMKEKGYLIEFTPELISEVGKRGFDPVLGARPLRRLMQDTLEANLSKMILENKLLKGSPIKVGAEILV